MKTYRTHLMIFMPRDDKNEAILLGHYLKRRYEMEHIIIDGPSYKSSVFDSWHINITCSKEVKHKIIKDLFLTKRSDVRDGYIY